MGRAGRVSRRGGVLPEGEVAFTHGKDCPPFGHLAYVGQRDGSTVLHIRGELTPFEPFVVYLARARRKKNEGTCRKGVGTSFRGGLGAQRMCVLRRLDERDGGEFEPDISHDAFLRGIFHDIFPKMHVASQLVYTP